jgi:nucleoside 2-deoxyribosyltransferase
VRAHNNTLAAIIPRPARKNRSWRITGTCPVSYIYIITPVGSDPQYKLKRELLGEVSKETGRELFFPLERHAAFSLNAALADLRSASLVIADLSLERPSCYFELGIAQALEVPICVMATVGTPLHQTAGPISTLRYSDLDQYREIIRQAVVSAPASRDL